MILTNIRRTGVFILFSVMNILIYGQVDLLTKHMECEQRIKECYPNLGKKNANGSYSIYCKDQWTIIKDANFSYSSTAIFVEPGNLPQPLCETTITISKNKITLKIHDAVMISPDVSDKPIWSEDGSTYGYICLKPKDPYRNNLGCTSGSHTIKKGGIKIMTDVSYDEAHARYDETVNRLFGIGQSTCSHSCRYIPIHVTGRKRYTGERVGGSPSAASDGLSPYRFDHNQTITYSWDEIAANNKMSKDKLIRYILENEIVGIYVGNNDACLIFNQLQCDYIHKFIWNLFGYSENKVKMEQEEARVEQARLAIEKLEAERARLVREKEELQERQKMEREMIIQKMQMDYKMASEKFQEADSVYQSNREDAYNKYVIAIRLIFGVLKLAQEHSNDQLLMQSISPMLMQSDDLLFELYLKVLKCSYEISLYNSQFAETFHAIYNDSRQALSNESFSYANRIIASSAIEAKRYDEAIHYLDIAILEYHNSPELNKNEYIPKTHKAYCLSCIGQEKAAIELIENVIAQFPENLLPIETKGRILILNGKKKQAKEWWEKTVLPKFQDKAYETEFYKALKGEHIIK